MIIMPVGRIKYTSVPRTGENCTLTRLFINKIPVIISDNGFKKSSKLAKKKHYRLK